MVPAGIPAAGATLGEVEHHRVGGALELVAKARTPGGDPERGTRPGDLQGELVDIEILVIETVLHARLRRAAGKETGGLAPGSAQRGPPVS